MSLFEPRDRALVVELSELVNVNPFVPERIEHERAALRDEFDETRPKWNVEAGNFDDHPNVILLCEHADRVIEDAREKFEAGKAKPAGDEAVHYDNLCQWVLYHRYRSGFDRALMSDDSSSEKREKTYRMYDDFDADAQRYLRHTASGRELLEDVPHLFASCFHLRRAFHNIFNYIYGVSKPAIRLRASVWESIFTWDMRRFRRTLYKRMHDFTTLVIGPSGTGKELVARAVGMSRYIPFDPAARRFDGDYAGSFYSLNLSALSPTLIESELFGHQRGAFTGAVKDREGWLEVCPPLGTVFLDEIGELDPTIQVKMLRVLQDRRFQRLGDTRTREFAGKIIAATNRDIAAAMKDGDFRADFYYRLCSDTIETPSLKQRIASDPGELSHLIGLLVRRMVGPDAEADGIVRDVETWIDEHLGERYEWPGNVRELEQCVRNVMIRREYHPAEAGARDVEQRLATEFCDGKLTADEMLRRYITLVYARVGSYEGAARELDLDRRTVKAKVDVQLLEELG